MRDLIVYLAAAVLAVPLAKRLGLGSVLGYLIGGCIIGPWGFALVTDVESILHLAEFGVVLMLFLIGLELDLDELWKLRAAVLVGGGVQVGVTGILLTVGLVALGLPWQAALAAGFALAMSSTAIGMQIMAERNMVQTPAGSASFAILLFQDIAAIPLIAIVPFLGASLDPASGTAGHEAGGWLAAVKAFGAIILVIFGGRFLVRPVLRVVARADVREIFTAFALLLVFGIAQLMQLAGLSMALGAFLAGVLLASSEYRHALETDIAPFKGLLLGLFFIGVGMSIDFGLVAKQPGLLALLVVGLIVIKVAVLIGMAKAFGVSTRERLVFAALLGQGGEFAFVVFSAAESAHLLIGQWVPLLTAAVALSMAATPLLMVGVDLLTARNARRDRDADTIDDNSAPVIIAGFGRYGQVVGRFLLASGLKATVLDHDPDQIELLKRFGTKVFYGDATRLDLLHAAGAQTAKLLVIAIDDVDDSLALAKLAVDEFPHLKIVARARNVRHWLELRELGITAIERETYESALRSGREAAEILGIAPFEARQIADKFRRHNLKTLDDMVPEFRDEQKAVARAKSARDELENMLEQDRVQRDDEHNAGWQ